MRGPETCVVSMQRDCLAAAQAQLQEVFAAAVEGGVTFFDTAEVCCREVSRGSACHHYQVTSNASISACLRWSCIHK